MLRIRKQIVGHEILEYFIFKDALKDFPKGAGEAHRAIIRTDRARPFLKDGNDVGCVPLRGQIPSSQDLTIQLLQYCPRNQRGAIFFRMLLLRYFESPRI